MTEEFARNKESGVKLSCRTALVTGAASGIGRAIALNLAKEGADVVVNDIDLTAARNVVSEIEMMGRKALAVTADVSKSAEINEMVGIVLRRLGQIDILVNNAGGGARERASLFHESTEEIWDSVIGRNLKGVLICTRAVINHMIARRYGKIINIASTAGVVGDFGLADYSAAKAGIIGFTKALAKEVGQYGINVVAVSPGLIETPGALRYGRKGIEAAKRAIVLPRIGKPEDVANLVAFLASDDASYITGQNYLICGRASIT